MECRWLTSCDTIILSHREIAIIKTLQKNIGFYGLLLLGLTGGLLYLRFLTADNLVVALPKHLQDLITLALSVIIESLPFILLGIVLSIVVQIWLPSRSLISRLPKNPFLRRFCLSFLGVFLPVCECGNVPLTRSLIRQGLKPAESLTFLLAAPIINPVTIITTHQAFGADNSILVARIFGGLLIANLIGWIYSRHPRQNDLLKKDFAATCGVDDHGHEGESRFRKSLELFSSEARGMMPALFVGALLAGLIQVFISREFLLTLGSSPVWSIGAMILLAFIVSICSNVDAFFALAFKSTFTAGSIVSFLVFGPIIDIKMLSLMRTTFTAKTLVQISLIVTLVSVLIGLAVNYAF